MEHDEVFRQQVTRSGFVFIIIKYDSLNINVAQKRKLYMRKTKVQIPERLSKPFAFFSLQ